MRKFATKWFVIALES